MSPIRADNTVDVYHGVEVADPYRPLEDPDAPETRAWLEEQRRRTRGYLDSISAREAIAARLRCLWDFPRYGAPRQFGRRIFFYKNDGLRDQAVLYRQDGDEAPRIVLDPNTWSDDGTVALSDVAFSEDGGLCAYSVSSHGSDWQEIRILDVASGRSFDESIRWCKFASIAWKRDNSGFFYNRLPEPGSVPPEDQHNHSRVYWHRLGTMQAEDALVYERPDAKELLLSPWITEDGQYLFLIVNHGTSPKNRLYYHAVEGDGPFVRLLDEADAAYHPIEVVGPLLYLHTDLDAPRGRIIAIDLDNPGRERWRAIVPQGDEVIAFVTMLRECLVVVYLRDAHHRVALYDLHGSYLRDVQIPPSSTVSWLFGRRAETACLLTVASFLQPDTILRYDAAKDDLTALHESPLPFDPAGYETRQVFYPSRDGTRVPMFLIHKHGLRLDGQNPTILYGYGGFNISLTPDFAVSRLPWLEAGGVYAIANLRGGGEYGEAWHEAGMLERKQNVFDDFIAAAEWLITSGHTSTPKLAIMGGSNGGLLVAACMTQRPDLFGAVVCAVPVIDMLRYHKFTVGHYWIPEYGNAEADIGQFRVLYAYSPLQNIRPGVSYPPTLITTGESDDRVDPAHARKFAAALQAAQAGHNPILLRVETRAGHGARKPTSKQIEEQSDIYAFLFHVLGLQAEDRR